MSVELSLSCICRFHGSIKLGIEFIQHTHLWTLQRVFIFLLFAISTNVKFRYLRRSKWMFVSLVLRKIHRLEGFALYSTLSSLIPFIKVGHSDYMKHRSQFWFIEVYFESVVIVRSSTYPYYPIISFFIQKYLISFFTLQKIMLRWILDPCPGIVNSISTLSFAAKFVERC